MQIKIKRVLWQISLFIVWGILILIQHIATFDIFNSDALHLYLIAGCVAILQYLIVILNRKRWMKVFLWICGLVYAICTCGKLIQLCIAHMFQPYPLGLSICSLVLNIVGVFVIIIAKKSTERQGTVLCLDR